MKGRRPPRRKCPRCGGHHYAWAETTLCVRCVKETADDSAALVEQVRERRLARRQETIDTLEGARVDYWGNPC